MFMLYLRVPQITSVLCQDEGAYLLYYYDIGEKICRMFFIRRPPRENGNRFDSREHVRHLSRVSKSRFAIFKQYNVNNVKLNS